MIKRILFLMSDTGGGHRAAAEAIRDALWLRYGRQKLDIQLIDIFKEMSFPLNYMPKLYPWLVNNVPSSYSFSYNLSNTSRGAEVLSKSMYFTNGHRLRRVFRDTPADVVVSVHSIITRPSVSAFSELVRRPPIISVVTDLVSTHTFWYDERVERCLVPTQAAYERGLECGMRPDQMRVTGLPVNPQFQTQLEAYANPRAELGWNEDLPTILMMAGGDGMGPLYETARAINAKRLKCQLVIVAGRNKQLKQELEAARWNQPTHIYGFVNEVPQMMKASDILITKAGPATICEAAIAGLPMILSDFVPGQEEGNVDYVVQNNAGRYAPNPRAVAEITRQWLSEGKQGLIRRSAAASRLARPDAVWDIAEEVWQYANRPNNVAKRRNIAVGETTFNRL